MLQDLSRCCGCGVERKRYRGIWSYTGGFTSCFPIYNPSIDQSLERNVSQWRVIYDLSCSSQVWALFPFFFFSSNSSRKGDQIQTSTKTRPDREKGLTILPEMKAETWRIQNGYSGPSRNRKEKRKRSSNEDKRGRRVVLREKLQNKTRCTSCRADRGRGGRCAKAENGRDIPISIKGAAVIVVQRVRFFTQHVCDVVVLL